MLNSKLSKGLGVFLPVFLLGLYLRLKLYFFNPGLHCDEASLALNMFDASYAELFKPLIRLQVAPPFFLVLAKYFYRFVNINYTADFSDMMLRLIPLISGIAAIPAFGYLLNLIFKNKFINFIGMFFLAINACAISYSCIFKQYSTEMLVSILILIMFMKSWKYKFLVLGLTPYFSLTSFFILPSCFCNLFIETCKNKDWKNFGTGILTFLIPFLSFILIFLIPVSLAHYGNMEGYWAETFSLVSNPFDYIKAVTHFLFRTQHALVFALAYCVSAAIMLVKNYKLFLYIAAPMFVTFVLTITRHYPLSERFLLFLLPLVLIVYLYPLTLVSRKLQTIAILFIVYTFFNIPFVDMFHLKQEYGKEAWSYLAQTYDGKSPVILGEEFVTNLYYRTFYSKDFNYYDTAYAGKKNSYEAIKLLPKGTWYFIISRYNMRYYKDFANYLSTDVEVRDIKLIQPLENPKSNVVIDIPPAAVIKIEK